MFLLAVGFALAYLFVRMARTTDSVTDLIKGTEREVLPVIEKVGGSVDRVNAQLDKVDQVTDSAVDAADSRRHRGPRGEHGDHEAGAEDLRLRRRCLLRRRRLEDEARLEARGAGRQGSGGAAGAGARRRAQRRRHGA